MQNPENIRDADFQVVGRSAAAPQPWGMDVPAFLTVLHLGLLANLIVPPVGWILPAVMWLTCRQADARIDLHGKVVMNWALSSLLYTAVFTALCFVLIGFPLLGLLWLANLLFAIIAAVKANRGELWRYPGSIPFFRTVPA